MATATAAAALTGVLNIVFGCYAAKLDGCTNILGDFTLEFFEFTLGFKEVTGDFIGKKCITGCFELGDLRLAQLDTGTLLVSELVTALMDALILEACGVIGEETLDLRLIHTEGRIRDDFGAKFFGFRNNGGLFGNG